MATIRLSIRERNAMRKFVSAVEGLMDLGAESVGIIADHVGEYGTGSDGDALEDAVVVECLRVVVDRVGSPGRTTSSGRPIPGRGRGR